MNRVRLATVWLDGCSGCHMSLLDTDERLLELVAKADIVYSPIVDAKEFPHDVDVTLVEGSVSSDDDLEKIRHVRQHTRILIAFGDCGVNGNVPAMRNQHGPEPVIERVYFENADVQQQRPARRCRRCSSACDRCTRWCMWTCTCPAARLRRT
jgi:NAD-reducing hydrogenase small subunit